MPVQKKGAQRASRRWSFGPLFVAVMAAILAVGGVITDAQPTDAASRKVVIVVGPAEGTTDSYRSNARDVARKARSYGAQVVELYSPNATWARVKRAARGAHLFVYVGHGNGWPSPYAPNQPYTKNGMGLNSSAGRGDYNNKYYGEHYIRQGLKLARGAVVLIIGACYAAGNSEGTQPTYSAATARQRVDNYGAGFLRTGARVLIADIIGNVDYILHGLFRSDKTMRQIFWSSPRATKRWMTTVSGNQSPGWARGILDPYKPYAYMRSIMGDLDFRASSWR
ncbi:MAG: hypothetical protein M3432_03945 [Chloroflexota bacterium]|nr:hypothetical protein [Chloroflexota bacterium]